MPNYTEHYNFPKPLASEWADISVINAVIDQIDTALKNAELKAATTQQATGTATEITLTLSTLYDGYTITFTASANNNGSATTINGKEVFNAGTTTPPTFIKDKDYTVRYSLSEDYFFVKASAEGTAIADHVLAGDTFSNSNDTNIQGTMPKIGAVNKNLSINEVYTIAKGYHDGTGKVYQTITTKAQQTYTPGTSDQTITSGQYLTGSQIIKGDSNLVASNIVKDANIFGIIGSATPKNLGGSYYNSGTFTFNDGSAVTISLGYKPYSVILITKWANTSYTFYTGINTLYSYHLRNDYLGSIGAGGVSSIGYLTITSNGFTFYNVNTGWSPATVQWVAQG